MCVPGERVSHTGARFVASLELISGESPRYRSWSPHASLHATHLLTHDEKTWHRVNTPVTDTLPNVLPSKSSFSSSRIHKLPSSGREARSTRLLESAQQVPSLIPGSPLEFTSITKLLHVSMLWIFKSLPTLKTFQNRTKIKDLNIPLRYYYE